MGEAMKRWLKFTLPVVVLAGVGFGAVQASKGNGASKNGFTLVKVERGTITEKALATGQIVPEQEIEVKSQISGIVKQCFAEVGDRVEVGQALFAITPDPTPLELNEVERGVQLAEVAFAKASADFGRNGTLWREGILSKEAFDASQQAYDQARIQLELARERRALTTEGKISRAKGAVDSVIRAPAAGTVLKRHVNPGDPVVPLTSYQAGTPLMTLADMGTLRFKGTVDEIDVGKLKEGLPVRIKIGALPSAGVTGRLTRIAPKATEKEGTTLFDVEASIDNAGTTTLRAGYSANADVVIQEKANVLLLPERLVSFEKEKAFVEVAAKGPETQPLKKEIKTGLSDGLKLEIAAGLAEGDQVVQRPPKEIK
jgi:HlyD family secretion protein